MPYQSEKRGPLMTTNINISTGAVSENVSGYHSLWFQTNKSNSIRRPRPSDLFAGGTSYSAYTMSLSDQRYRRPPSAVPGFIVWTPVQKDDSLSWGDYTPDYSKVESRLRAKIKSMNANLAQNVAEYRQASSMFAGLARDIIQTFRSLRSGRALADFVRILQRPKSKIELAIANRWLQYQYGLKPLLSDLYETSDALARGIRDGMPLYVRSAITERITQQVTTSEGSLVIRRVDAQIRGVARYKISDPSMKMLSQFGITNPLLLVWELIPYSFVIDWMFPVGNFLTSLDALNGTSDLRVQTSCRESHSTDYIGKYGGSGQFQGTRYNRNGITGSLSMPKLGYKPSSSLTAVANGMALLTQLRHR